MQKLGARLLNVRLEKLSSPFGTDPFEIMRSHRKLFGNFEPMIWIGLTRKAGANIGRAGMKLGID